MTNEIAAHLNLWVMKWVRPALYDVTLNQMLRFLDAHPEYADGSYPWTLVMDRASAWDVTR